jgi:hypothetical protein
LSVSRKNCGFFAKKRGRPLMAALHIADRAERCSD